MVSACSRFTSKRSARDRGRQAQGGLSGRPLPADKVHGWPRLQLWSAGPPDRGPQVQSGVSSRTFTAISWFTSVNSMPHRFTDRGLEVLERGLLPGCRGGRMARVWSRLLPLVVPCIRTQKRLEPYGCSVSVPMSKPYEAKWRVANMRPLRERHAHWRGVLGTPHASLIRRFGLRLYYSQGFPTTDTHTESWPPFMCLRGDGTQRLTWKSVGVLGSQCLSRTLSRAHPSVLIRAH